MMCIAATDRPERQPDLAHLKTLLPCLTDYGSRYNPAVKVGFGTWR